MKNGYFTIMQFVEILEDQVVKQLEHQNRDCNSKKIMLSLCWDFRGVIFCELLNAGGTIYSILYGSQLIKLWADS